MRILALSLCLLACDSTPSAPTKREVKGPFLEIEPSALVYSYRSNSVGADSKYKGRALEIAGVVTRVGQDMEGVPLVVLKDNHADSTDSLLTIQCAWDGDRSKVTRLHPGTKVILRGIGAGLFVGDPLVVLCDGDEAPAEKSAPIQTQIGNPYLWRRDIETFLNGRGVKKFDVTYSGDNVTIAASDCDKARDAVDANGSLPAGYTVTCTTDGVVKWKMP